MKQVSNISFSNIVVDDSSGGKGCAFIVTGMPDHPVEGISFSDIRATFPGGGSADDARSVLAEYTPENLKDRWPEYGSLRGTVPACGLYARHVKGIAACTMSSFDTFKPPTSDPPIVFVDVTGERLSGSPEPKRP